jgi:hypothetical protein
VTIQAREPNRRHQTSLRLRDLTLDRGLQTLPRSPRFLRVPLRWLGLAWPVTWAVAVLGPGAMKRLRSEQKGGWFGGENVREGMWVSGGWRVVVACVYE